MRKRNISFEQASVCISGSFGRDPIVGSSVTHARARSYASACTRVCVQENAGWHVRRIVAQSMFSGDLQLLPFQQYFCLSLSSAATFQYLISKSFVFHTEKKKKKKKDLSWWIIFMLIWIVSLKLWSQNFVSWFWISFRLDIGLFCPGPDCRLKRLTRTRTLFC